ncbi:MAG: hypothetical protein ACQERX_06385 [Bacillota bacterium]
MEIKTTGEIIDKWDEIEEITEESKWVSLESVLKKLDEIAHRLYHDTSVTCWEELASEFREELTKK